jgi:hypothetical protein
LRVLGGPVHPIHTTDTQPQAETVIEKINSTPEYLDYYKQRADLDNEQEALDTKLRQAQRSRDREAIRLLQREFRQTQSTIAKLEMTHPGAPIRAMRRPRTA